MAYQSKDAGLSARELESQSCVAEANLVAGSSDLPSNISIDNSTIAATVITLSVNEVVGKCYAFKVSNRITGAIVSTAAAPSTAVAQKISAIVNGTGLTDVIIQVIFSVA